MKISAWEDLVRNVQQPMLVRNIQLSEILEKSKACGGPDEHQCMGGFGKECPAINNSTRVKTSHKLQTFLLSAMGVDHGTSTPLYARHHQVWFAAVPWDHAKGYYAGVLRRGITHLC